MRILFVHQNFPGQYLHIAAHLADRPGYRVVAVGEHGNLGRLRHPRVEEVGYASPEAARPTTHPFVRHLENAVYRGEVAAATYARLKRDGFEPDVILCHPGWGEALFLRDIWPDAPILSFCEFFYGAHGRDVGFDPEFPRQSTDDFRTRIRTASALINLEAMDWGISPTQWQHSTYPDVFRPKITVCFDGIDTDAVCPRADAKLRFGSGTRLTADNEVITFVSRNLEPYRGYHVFMRALPEMLARHPNAHAVIVGGDDVSYGSRPKDGQSYKARYLDEVKDRLDLSRVHLVGKIAYSHFLDVLRVSSVHVYLSYPFVLSWSMLEAMSAGCLIAGSRTPPVEEFLVDEDNGLLFDFFDSAGLIAAVDTALDRRSDMVEIRRRARETAIARCDLKRVCLPIQLDLVETLAAGRLPPPFGDDGARPTVGR